MHIVTGDDGASAAAVVREVGIGELALRVVPKAEMVSGLEPDELLLK
ncbi:hypothetical protein [Streptomyces sp. CB03234]|nr:hypothetical protein [Streptomyces sp. CB03234]